MDENTWTDAQKKDHIRECAAADDIYELSRQRHWTPGVSVRKITEARAKVKSEGRKSITKEEGDRAAHGEHKECEPLRGHARRIAGGGISIRRPKIL
jgi:hypothetical protein